MNISHFWLGLYPLVTRNVVNTHRLPSGKMQMQINFQVHAIMLSIRHVKIPKHAASPMRISIITRPHSK